MSQSNSILLKVQNALVAYVNAATLTFTPYVRAGLSYDQQMLPAVVCQADDADNAIAPVTGNWRVSCTVLLRENADDTTEAQHLTRAGEIANLFVTDNLEADLTTYGTDLTVFAYDIQNLHYGITDRSWVSSIRFTLDCKGS